MIDENTTQVFNVMTADPPWKFGDRVMQRGAENKYQCLSTEDICRFPLPSVGVDSILFLWRCSAMVEEAYQVVRAWGFVPKSEIVWQKLTRNGLPWFGMGRYVRASHETCIVATRGRFKVASRSIRSVFSAKVPSDTTGRYIHSAKPEEFRDLVDQLTGGVPVVELFGRKLRPGWTVLGNQVGLY